MRVLFHGGPRRVRVADPAGQDLDSPLKRLLHSQESPYPTVREVLVGALIILVLLGSLWGYTGQPINRSAVRVVTTGSMMHCTNGFPPLGRDCDDPHFGRLGTIDPGDMILLMHVSDPTAVSTEAAGGKSHYGKSGDVVVYRPDGQPSRTPVIHRALFWLQMNDDDTFTIAALGLDHVDNLDQPQVRALGLGSGYADSVMKDARLDSVCGPVGPARSGFITRGDNNAVADQALHSPISTCPVKTAWVLGKARGELPWIGLIRLVAGDVTSGSRDYHNAAGDTKVLMWSTILLLVGGPYVYEKVRERRRRRAAPPPG
jgi:signal peptidase I